MGRGEAARPVGRQAQGSAHSCLGLAPTQASVPWPLGCWLSRASTGRVGGVLFQSHAPCNFALVSALYLSYQNEVKQNRRRAKTLRSEILLTAEKKYESLKRFLSHFPQKQEGAIPTVLSQACLQHLCFAGRCAVINFEQVWEADSG